MSIKISDLIPRKKGGRPITMLTAYDYPTAKALDEGGIDVILVGDSVGTNVLGYQSEQQVTVDDMVHHAGAVRRGVKNAFVLVDLPYASYETPDQAVRTALRLRTAGADGVKVEGHIPETIKALKDEGVAICNHLGLQPQTQTSVSIQGKTFTAARLLVEQCVASEAAGSDMLVLELLPRQLAKIITGQVGIPTIGIGAGQFTDGQVLVINDIVGITPKAMRHTARYAEFGLELRESIVKYRTAVNDGSFPGPANSVSMDTHELDLLESWLSETSH
jgi:3-methyl-2-oxobutanoate hydroxymethyltransferase